MASYGNNVACGPNSGIVPGNPFAPETDILAMLRVGSASQVTALRAQRDRPGVDRRTCSNAASREVCRESG